jgi:hypothetical protein
MWQLPNFLFLTSVYVCLCCASVAEPHNIDAAQAPRRKNDGAPALTSILWLCSANSKDYSFGFGNGSAKKILHLK